MKKILSTLLIIPMVWACSSKDDLKTNTATSTITLNATIEIPTTKVSPVDLSQNTVSFDWNEGDVVKVATFGSTEIQTFTIINSSIDKVNHKASFTGTPLSGGMTSYFVFYNYPDDGILEIITRGKTPATTTPRAVYYENSFRPFAIATNGTSAGFTLDYFQPVLKLNLKGEVSVKKVAICGYTNQQEVDIDMLLPGDDGLQLNDTTATSIYFPINDCPDGFNIGFFDASDKLIMSQKIYSKSDAETAGKTYLDLTEGKIYNLPEITVAPAIPEGALSGVFSVSATKKVRFSKGNLQATCTKAGAEGTSEYSWGFAEHQYDTLGRTSGNATIADQTLGAKVDLFGWVGASGTLAGNATKYGIAVSSNATKTADFGNVLGEKLKADWGTTIDNDGTWRSLTIDEVGYLFSFKGEEGEGKPDFTNPTRQGLNAYNVTVAGHKNCIVLYPDGFTGTKVSTGDETSYDTPEEWAAAEAQGVVCLPAAGYRVYSNVKFVGEKSFYWTSSSPASGSNNTSAFPFGVGYVIYNASSRVMAGSVRLVTEVK